MGPNTLNQIRALLLIRLPKTPRIQSCRRPCAHPHPQRRLSAAAERRVEGLSPQARLRVCPHDHK